MNKLKSITKGLVSCSLVLFVILSFLFSSTQAKDTINVIISPEYSFQTLKGWGTSLSWWGNSIGSWKNETKKNEILDLIFNESNGLGFNVARYNIGGGDNPSHTHMRNGAMLEGYQPYPGVWDYNADATQRQILSGAIDRGVNIVEGFSKTPPFWMTYSGCSAGNIDGKSNLRPDYYDDYANYLAEVYLLFKDRFGVTFDSISPINEPNGPWWKVNNRQEGCHYTREEQNKLFKVMKDVFDSKGLSNVTLAGPEGFEFKSTLSSWDTYDDNAKSAIGKINTHSYFGNERLLLNSISLCTGKRLSMSEFGVGVGEHDHNAIDSALVLAHKIRDDVRELQPETWVYWQAVEEEFYTNNWGLIHANFKGDEEYEITKQYYGMANFSKFIRPGSTIIGANNPNILASLNKDTNTLCFVVINDSKYSHNYTFDLSKFSSLDRDVSIYRTSTSENLNKLDNMPIDGNSLDVMISPQSITTFVINNAVTNLEPAFGRNCVYKIVNKSDNTKVLDVRNSSPENSAEIIIAGKSDSSKSQGWKLICNDLGEYYIANVNAAKMLDVPRASRRNGVIMKLWQANGDSNQLWSIVDLHNGYFSIIGKNSGKALGVKNGDMTEGNNIDQYDYYGYENQQWKFELVK